MANAVAGGGPSLIRLPTGVEGKMTHGTPTLADDPRLRGAQDDVERTLTVSAGARPRQPLRHRYGARRNSQPGIKPEPINDKLHNPAQVSLTVEVGSVSLGMLEVRGVVVTPRRSGSQDVLKRRKDISPQRMIAFGQLLGRRGTMGSLDTIRAKLGLAVVLVSFVALSGDGLAKASGGAAEDGPDIYNVAAGTPVKATGFASLFFPGSLINISCTLSSWSGNTRTTLKIGITPPVFSDAGGAPCTDGSGTTYSFAANDTNGSWTAREVDSTAHGGDEGLDPNFKGDHMQITIPKAGLVITSSQGCAITVAPTGSFQMNGKAGKYDDHGAFTLTQGPVPFSVTGGAQCSTETGGWLSAKYTLSPLIYDMG